MEVFEAIKKRRSIRRFDPTKEVTDKQIEKFLEAARWAPSAGNLQSWFFVVVKNKKTKQELAKATLGQDFVAQAPVVIVSCADLERSASRYGGRGEKLYAFQDATIANQNIWLAATEMGLGAVWVGAFDENEVSRILNLPSHLRPIAILPIGYPAESPSPPSRRSITEISRKV
ncbi:nitroreductase family protein [Patescibacteria group bacterium]|nr:nitroreductase family protein [Patescibacteria group bacterium]